MCSISVRSSIEQNRKGYVFEDMDVSEQNTRFKTDTGYFLYPRHVVVTSEQER